MGVRAHTFFGNGIVGHVSLAKPVCVNLAEKVREISQSKSWDCHFGQTYVCVEGPYFSTKAESHHYREMGADIIGMTHFPEYALAREVGLLYLPCCFITDYDCWDDSIPHVTLEEVIQVMRFNNTKAYEINQDILSNGDDLYVGCECSEQGLKTGLMSKTDVPWLDVLL
mgnify:FL=1